VGYVFGPALSDAQKGQLEEFIDALGSGEIALFEGPLNFQDGSVYLQDGEVATESEVWYLPQLLEGMEGPSE
jgi:simple sugar transport system substrate-binding protein